MKKTILGFILSCVMILGTLTGCASNEKVSNESTKDMTKDTEVGNEIEVMTGDTDKTDNHQHSYTQEIIKEPTCNEKGMVTYTCVCGDTYTEGTSNLDHCTDRNEITKKPTCEEEGIETFYCIFCGEAIYTEKIAKLQHTENCNHGVEETVTDPKKFTFTQCIKMMYVTDTTGLYGFPDVNSDPYRYLEKGTAVPVIAKCDQANFYRTPCGITVSGENLSEVRPGEYATGKEESWENFKEETDSRYTYWTGIYRVNGYELHCERLNKPYVERLMKYARQGLYTLMYRDVDSEHWSGCYEIMVEENGEFLSSEYMDWIVAYMEAKGINVSVKSEEFIVMYRSPKDENSKKLRVISVSVGK